MKTYVLKMQKKATKTDYFTGLYMSYLIDADSLQEAKQKWITDLHSEKNNYWGNKYSIEEIFEENLPEYKKRIHCDICGEFNLVVFIDKDGNNTYNETTCDFCQFESTIVKIGKFTKNKVDWEIYEYTEEAQKHEIFSGEIWVKRTDRPDKYHRATELAYTLISEMKEPSYNKLPKALLEVL